MFRPVILAIKYINAKIKLIKINPHKSKRKISFGSGKLAVPLRTFPKTFRLPEKVITIAAKMLKTVISSPCTDLILSVARFNSSVALSSSSLVCFNSFSKFFTLSCAFSKLDSKSLVRASFSL